MQGAELVGRRVRVYWAPEKTWYSGKIREFNPLTSQHIVYYDDGDQRKYVLSDPLLQWELLEPAVAVPRPSSSSSASSQKRHNPPPAAPSPAPPRWRQAAGGVTASKAISLLPRSRSRVDRISELI